MQITIDTSTDKETIWQMAYLAKEAKLYVKKESYMLLDGLNEILREDVEVISFTIAYFEDKPIGCGVVFKEVWIDEVKIENLVMTYVKTSFRNMGIGRNIINELKQKCDFVALEGINGSATFYNKVGIPLC